MDCNQVYTCTMKLNKEWHLGNKMPKNPTKEQRLQWHIEHSQNCHCREMSEKLKAEVVEYLKTKE